MQSTDESTTQSTATPEFKLQEVIYLLKNKRTFLARTIIDTYEDKTNDEWKYANARCLIDERHLDDAIALLETIESYNQVEIKISIARALQYQKKPAAAIAKLKEINDWENIYGALKALINIYKQFHSFEDIKIIIEMLIKSQNINNESKISILEELTQYYLTQRKYEVVVSIKSLIPNLLLSDNINITLGNTYRYMARQDNSFIPLTSAKAIINEDPSQLDRNINIAINCFLRADPDRNNPKVLIGISRIYEDIGTAILANDTDSQAVRQQILGMSLELLLKVHVNFRDRDYLLALAPCYRAIGMLDQSLDIYRRVRNGRNLNQNRAIESIIYALETQIYRRNLLQQDYNHAPQTQAYSSQPQTGQSSRSTPSQSQSQRTRQYRQRLFNEAPQQITLTPQVLGAMLRQAYTFEDSNYYEDAYNIYRQMYELTSDINAYNGMCRCSDATQNQETYRY
jgi:hypothetical protein